MKDCQGWKYCVNYLMNRVNLSDFDPGTPPVVTDFVKDIQKVSEDPLITMIKEFITGSLSLFKSDLLTTMDMHHAIKSAQMFNISVELRNTPSSNVIGKVLKQTGTGKSVRAWKGRDNLRLWVIRNHEKYENMTGSQLYDSYQSQMLQVKNDSNLSMVV